MILRIPNAPAEYDQSYFAQVWRAINSWSNTVGPYDAVSAAAVSTRTVTATGLIGITDGVILVDTTAGNMTLSLPAVTTANIGGRQFTVKRITAGVNTLTVDTADGTNIDGAATVSIGTQWNVRTFRTNGSQYYIVGSF